MAWKPKTRHDPQRNKRESQRAYDQRRGSARERGYTAAWDKAAKQHLANEPLCRACLLQERVTPATQVDHIIPHRGDMDLFWDRDNWQSLCATHHSAKTRAGQ